VDAGEQAADPVGDAGGLAGQVVVEADQHIQLGQGVVTDVDRPQGVRQCPGCVGDDERVPRVGLRATWVEIGDAAHGQTGQIGDLVAGCAGDRDRQGADRGGLINHDQQPSVLGELVEQRPQFGFAVGQRPVVQPLSGEVQADGVVFAFADVQAEEDPETTGHLFMPFVRRGWSPVEHRWPAPTLRRDLPTGGRVPIQRSFDATRPGDTTPRIMPSTGGVSHAGPGDHSSLDQELRKR